MPKDTFTPVTEATERFVQADGTGAANQIDLVAMRSETLRAGNDRARAAKRAGKATGLTLIALSLAACGGSSSTTPAEEEPTVYSLTQFVAAVKADTLAEKFEVNVEPGNVGTLSIAELRAVIAAFEGAENNEAALQALDAALVAGTVTVTVADTADALIAFAAEFPDDLEGVTSIVVTGPAATLTVAELQTIDGLGATFTAAPDVLDTLENADGESISGVRNVTLTIVSTTPGADASEATITASGSGTVTFNFADSDDTVTLLAGSTLEGFTTLEIVAGTVDVTAADLGDIEVITVASKIILTAAQFLAGEGIEGLSADSEVEIVVSTKAEAEAVIKAAGSLTGTLTSGNVNLSIAEGGDVTALELEALEADFDAAIDTAVSARALPEAIDDLEAAYAAMVEFAADLNERFGLEEGEQIEPLSGMMSSFLDDERSAAAETRDEGIVAAGGSGTFLTIAVVDRTTLQIAADVAATRVELGDAVIDATKAVSDARSDLVDAETRQLVTAYDNARLAEVAAVAADAKADESLDKAFDAAVAAAEKAADADYDNPSYELVDGILSVEGVEIARVDERGVLKINGTVVTLSPDGKNYVGAEPFDNYTVPKAEFDAVIKAAQAKYDAENNLDAAEDAVAAATAAFTKDGSDSDDVDALIKAYEDAKDDLAEAQANQTAFEDAYAAWNALNVELAELDVLFGEAKDVESAFDEALAKIENATDGDPAGLDINVVGANSYFFPDDTVGDGPSDDSDLFFVSTADGLSYIGAVPAESPSDKSEGGELLDISGTDFVRFDGTYSFVELDADAEIGDAWGSAARLEMFAQETADGVELYIENLPTAGNGTTAEDFTIITLAGVTLDDLSYNADTSILTATGTGQII